MNYYINKEIANLQIQDEQAKLYILGSNPSNFKLKTGYLHSHTSSKTLDWHSNYSILSEIIARTLILAERHPFFNGLTTLSGMSNLQLLKKSPWIMIFMITLSEMMKV